MERSGGGIRMFKDEDFGWLHIIECLKQTGMPIKEIKRFVDWCIEGDATIDQRLALIEQQREAVLGQIQQMQATLHMLDYKQWYYETAKSAGTCSVHDRLSKEEVPAEFHDILERDGRKGEAR